MRPGREQDHVGDDVLARLELDEALGLGHLHHLQVIHRLAAAKGDVRLAQLVDQLVDDLMVDELQGPGAPVDDRHLHPQGGKHGGVLDAHHAGADHGEVARQVVDVEDVVRGHDRLAVRGQPGRIAGAGAHGDQHLVHRQPAPALEPLHQNGVGIDEGGASPDDLDVVARQVLLHHRELALDDALHVTHELLHGGPRPRPELLVGLQPGAGVAAAHGFAERLGGDGAALDADAADDLLLLDHGDPLAQLGGLDGGALTGGPTPDADEVVVLVIVAHGSGSRASGDAAGPCGFYLNMGNLRDRGGFFVTGGQAGASGTPQRSKVSLRVCAPEAVTSRYTYTPLARGRPWSSRPSQCWRYRPAFCGPSCNTATR